MIRKISKLIFFPVRGLAKSATAQRKAAAMFHKMATTPHGQKTLHRYFKSFRWYHLMLARTQRQQGKDLDAFHSLMMGQRCPGDDDQLHIKLSELYRDNGDILAAHTHLKFADALKPGYSTIRLLTFESDHGMLKEGSATMAKVLKLSSGQIEPYLSMINRIALFYPEHQKSLQAYREKLKAKLLATPYRKPSQLTQAINKALACRWLDAALTISKDRKADLPSTTRNLLNRLHDDLGTYQPLLDLAWENESTDEVLAWSQEKRIVLSKEQMASQAIVELFIPTPFYAIPGKEKPTYKTVRAAFLQVIKFLLSRPDLIIVPRFQFYWRQGIPKVSEARVITYHTRGPRSPKHLHIQEAPLAGRCSFDDEGFAGFSSIATDHSRIEQRTADLSPTALEKNFQAIYQQYVVHNISKYQQSSETTPITEPYVFVALQISTDVVSKLAWIPGIELLCSVAAYYRGSGIRVAVKRHPYCGSMSMQKCLDELEAAGDIIRVDGSIHQLIPAAKIVITVNSGVGLEALMHGKPVIISGACDYSYAAITVKTREQLHEVLAAEPSANLLKIQQLLHYYVHHFTVSADSESAIVSRLEQWLS